MKITVRVEMSHLAAYGRETIGERAYECDFPVEVGDTVLLPGTDLHPAVFLGTVVSLDSDYDGPVRHVVGMIPK